MSEFIIQIEKLLTAFADPEYRYLVLEPLISYGLLAGVAMLVAGFFTKAPRLQVAALVVVGIAALTYFPYKEARLAAKPRLEQVYKISSPARVTDFAKNTNEWIATSWQFRLLVLAAFATLMIGIHRNRIGFGLSIATILLGLLSTKNAMWLNYQDALAYHPNLKQHEIPIDRKTADSVPPPSREPARAPAVRTPAAPVAKPVAPAALVPPPSYPNPITTPPANAGRIPAPAPPATTIKSRKVQPLPRY